MPPLQLVWRNLLKRKTRFVLTTLSLAIAVFLLCVLQSLVVALNAGVKAAAVNRLIVQSKVSLFVYLPQSYGPKIEQVERNTKLDTLYFVLCPHACCIWAFPHISTHFPDVSE